MKASEPFKQAIQQYLEKQAETDPLFAPVYAKTNKNIDDCVTYIFNQVQASGCNGFADEEIFGMAIHYYQEDDVKPGNPIQAKVIINHTSEKPKEVVKKEIKEQAQAPMVEMKPKPKQKRKAEIINTDQLTLF